VTAFYGVELPTAFMLGTAQYPSPAILGAAFRESAASVATVSVRREAAGAQAGEGFWRLIRDLGVHVLPNTAGCHSSAIAIVCNPIRLALSKRRPAFAVTGLRCFPIRLKIWFLLTGFLTLAARC
jgi:thiazole synthase ThiGH ThiG subunit